MTCRRWESVARQVSFTTDKRGKPRAYRVDMRQMRNFPIALERARLMVSTGAAVRVPFRKFGPEKANGGRVAKKKAKKNGPIKWLKRKRLAALKKKRLAEMTKSNPPKMRKVSGSTGWLKADAVRFVKKGGRTEVYIRRAKKRRRK